MMIDFFSNSIHRVPATVPAEQAPPGKGAFAAFLAVPADGTRASYESATGADQPVSGESPPDAADDGLQTGGGPEGEAGVTEEAGPQPGPQNEPGESHLEREPVSATIPAAAEPENEYVREYSVPAGRAETRYSSPETRSSRLIEESGFVQHMPDEPPENSVFTSESTAEIVSSFTGSQDAEPLAQHGAGREAAPTAPAPVPLTSKAPEPLPAATTAPAQPTSQTLAPQAAEPITQQRAGLEAATTASAPMPLTGKAPEPLTAATTAPAQPTSQTLAPQAAEPITQQRAGLEAATTASAPMPLTGKAPEPLTAATTAPAQPASQTLAPQAAEPITQQRAGLEAATTASAPMPLMGKAPEPLTAATTAPAQPASPYFRPHAAGAIVQPRTLSAVRTVTPATIPTPGNVPKTLPAAPAGLRANATQGVEQALTEPARWVPAVAATGPAVTSPHAPQYAGAVFIANTPGADTGLGGRTESAEGRTLSQATEGALAHGSASFSVGSHSTGSLSGARPAAELARDVARQIGAQVFNLGKGRFELSLAPAELGKVDMSLQDRENRLTLIVHAERPETMDLIRRHIGQLEQELRQMGLGNLSLQLGTGGAATSQGGQGQERQLAYAGDSDTPPEPVRRASPPLMAGDHLDIRL